MIITNKIKITPIKHEVRDTLNNNHRLESIDGLVFFEVLSPIKVLTLDSLRDIDTYESKRYGLAYRVADAITIGKAGSIPKSPFGGVNRFAYLVDRYCVDRWNAYQIRGEGSFDFDEEIVVFCEEKTDSEESNRTVLDFCIDTICKERERQIMEFRKSEYYDLEVEGENRR